MHAAVAPHEFEGVARHRVVIRSVRSRWLIGPRRVAWLARPSQFPRAVEADRRRLSVPLFDGAYRWSADPTPILCSKKASGSMSALLPRHSTACCYGRACRSRSGEPSGRPAYRSATATEWNSAAAAWCPRWAAASVSCRTRFRAAATLGWTIVERHGHTMEAVPSDDEPWGVDATIAWPYTDLRFAIPLGDPPARLHVRVVDDNVELQVWGETAIVRQVALTAVDARVEVVDGNPFGATRSCARSSRPTAPPPRRRSPKPETSVGPG